MKRSEDSSQRIVVRSDKTVRSESLRVHSVSVVFSLKLGGKGFNPIN